jgi:uroporphyrinogen III methyltransferase/synthase
VTGTLADIAERAAEVANPALIVVGDVVGFRDELRWFDTRPLHGVSVLVPRTRQQASELSERLRALGAEPVEAPTIRVEPTDDPETLRAALASMADGAHDWVVFTSANAVQAVWEQVEVLGVDARLFARVLLAAVGSGTAAALARHGLRADLVPPRATTAALADALIASGDPGRVLLPRADLATPVLHETLAGAGWKVEEVEAYRTLPAESLDPAVRERILDGDIDVLAFASSSTVANLVDLLGQTPPASARVATIGPVTSQTCRDLGIRVDAEADPHDLDGLVAAVLRAVRA